MNTAKPLVTPNTAGTTARIVFPNGRVALIDLITDEPGRDWGYHIIGEANDYRPASGVATFGRAANGERAMRAAWVAAADAPDSIKLSRDEVAELAQAAEDDTCEAAKILRKLLRLRTGFAWSVTVGKGSAYCWLTIRARIGPKDRKRATNAFGRLSGGDAALLSAILGHAVYDSESVRPCRNVRASYVWRIAGLEYPEGFRIAAPSWD